MYRSFYRLTTMPFTKHPDPSFWWVGKKQRNSLAALNQGIFEEQGFLLLSGDAGTGKTTLCRVLTEGFDHGVLWTALADPRLERLDLYNAIAAGFAFGGPFTSKVEFLLQIGQFLQQAGTAGKRVLLLIDDSHELSQELLEDLRLLVNLGNDQEKLLNILLVGRQELNHLLEQPKNRAIYQRLTVREEIIPLTGGETEEYLVHRLLAAGAEEKLFTDAAVRAIYTLSGGVPQQINALAEQALMVGAGRRLPVIGDEAVLNCARSLGLAVDLIDSVDTPGAAGFAGGLATSQKEPGTPQSGRKPGRRLFSGKGRWATALAVGGLLLGSYYLFDGVPSSPQRERLSLAKENPPAGVSTRLSQEESILPEISETVPPPELSSGTSGELSFPEQQPHQEPPHEPPPVVQAAEKFSAAAAGEPAEEKQSDPRPDPLAGGLVQDLPAPPLAKLSAELVKVRLEPEQDSAMVEEEVAALPVAPAAFPFELRRITLVILADELTLTRASTRELNAFAEKLRDYPQATLLVKGYVSSLSNSPENIELSSDRAFAVKELLVARGIAAERIIAQGMGNLEPIASNATALGRRQNRRVEIEVLSDGL